jgi:hypothetical protein
MATTRLQLYNAALMIIGERALVTLNDATEARRKLDDVWNNAGVLRCLEKGLWRFATRTSQLTYDQNITTSFGYANAFPKPTDWVKTVNVAQDEFFQQPCLRYSDEQGYLYADLTQLYVRYVSSDSNYGLNMALWTGAFTEMAEMYFASRVVRKLTNDDKKAALIQDPENPQKGWLPQAIINARNLDAWADAVKFSARGNWVNSRIRNGANSGSWNDMGNQNQLIG